MASVTYPRKRKATEINDAYIMIFDIMWYQHSFAHGDDDVETDAHVRQNVANDLGEDRLAAFMDSDPGELRGMLLALHWVLFGDWDAWDGETCEGICVRSDI